MGENELRAIITADISALRANMTEAEKLLVSYSGAVTRASTIAANAATKAEAAEREAIALMAKAQQARATAEAAKIKAIKLSEQAILSQKQTEENSSKAAIASAAASAKASERAATASEKANQRAVALIDKATIANQKAANAKTVASQSAVKAVQVEALALETARKKEAAAVIKAAADIEKAARRKERAEARAASATKKELAAASVARRHEANIAAREAKEVELAARRKERAEAAAADSTKKQIGGSTAVFQEFNRVIQDSPFGIIGVGNNIQQLASNFGHLAASQKSTGAALKASFASLTAGINPLILGVTVLTTAWTYYSMGAFDSKSATESFADALDKFKQSLDGVAQATLEGAGAAEKEIQKFKLLKEQAENANISLEDRLEAVKELQKEYPEYLGNLTEEQIKTGDVGEAYEVLTTKIIATAKARAYSDRIAENSIKILTAEEKVMERVRKLADLDAQRSKLEEGGGVTAIATTSGVMMTETGEKLSKIQGEINGLVEEQLADAAEISKINEENARLQTRISEQIEGGAKFTKATVENVKEIKNDFSIFLKDLQTAANVTPEIWNSGGSEKYAKELELVNTRIANLSKEKGKAKEAFDLFSQTQDIVNKKFAVDGALALDTYNAKLAETIAFHEKFEEAVKKIQEEGVNPVDQIQLDIAKNLPKSAPQKDEAQMYDPTEELKAIAAQAKLAEAAFDGLGQAVSAAFGGSPEWGRFLSSFIKFAGEIIASNFAISQSNIIAGATSTGAAAGPAAAFVTPGLITAGLALIGSLFGAILSSAKSSSGPQSGGSAKSYGVPGREHGGHVVAGQPYIVGEKRPELFVPKVSGTIIPRVGDYASRSGSTSSSMNKLTIDIEMESMLEGENIRLSNKRAERRVNKT